MAREDGGVRRIDGLAAMADARVLQAMRASVFQTYAHDAVLSYAVRLIEATRGDERLETGCGPRGTLALARLAKATAWLRGCDYVAPSDVAGCFMAVARHRVALSPSALVDGLSVEGVLTEVRASVPRPRFEHGGSACTGR